MDPPSADTRSPAASKSSKAEQGNNASDLERGSITAEQKLDIDCVDISMNGDHEFLNGVQESQSWAGYSKEREFSESHLEQLIDNAPVGKLRLLIIRGNSVRNDQLTDFVQQLIQPIFNRTQLDEYRANRWLPDDSGLFRQFLRFSTGRRFVSLLRSPYGIRDNGRYCYELHLWWYRSSPEHLVGMCRL